MYYTGQINVKAAKPAKGGGAKEPKESIAVNQYPELFDKCRPYLEGTATVGGGGSSGELPVSLQALLVKSQLLAAKLRDVTRRESEVRPVSSTHHARAGYQ